ncbi:Asp23/Gls24 family envelope stress response protein [Nocardia jejuensis]|uniref:Asp23/Gls24 family envelope stress response protein n=1 Tax=Nocardia jejuensis TaxID=328049 RepID=UPI0012FA9DAD|nr:Asp23/Gls24 family envelope stress response protein [Nocardia jejuensis]
MTEEPPGRTTVSERAVRRMAARAALEVDGVESGATVQATVTGDTATLRVSLPIRYPLPVSRIAEACRGHLIDRTRELAGVAVTEVDITVAALLTDAPPVTTGSPARRVR